MKKARRRYDREFKISIVAELESDKPLAQIVREQGIHPSLPSRWRDELAENPERAFSGNGNRCKYEAKIAELERLLGHAHAENELLKKSVRYDSEEVPGGKTKTGTRRRYMIIKDALSSGLQLSISRSCQALDVSRSGYRKWRKEQETIPTENRESNVLRDEIQEMALEFPSYGYRRITA